MNYLDASYKDEVLTRTGQLKSKYANRIDMVSIPFLNTEYLGFYMDNQADASVLKQKKIRQAINYGFDRHKMMKYMRNNITPDMFRDRYAVFVEDLNLVRETAKEVRDVAGVGDVRVDEARTWYLSGPMVGAAR